MDFHIINSTTWGGAELIASKLSNKFSKRLLIILFKKDDLFIKKLNIKTKGCAFLLKKIFIENNNKFFSHNIQAHIIVNLFKILKKSIKKKDKNKYYNVIHFDPFYIKKFWLYIFLETLKYSNSNIIFVSEYARNQLMMKINFPINYLIIYNSVSNKYLNKKNKIIIANKDKNSRINIGFIGRHANVKRLPLFLEIILELNRLQKDKFKFFIQSDISKKELDKLLKKINAKKNQLPKDKLNLILYRSENDPLVFYNSIDILISTSKTETFGLTCIEAIAMKKKLYTINSRSIETLFGPVNFNIKEDSIEKISARLIKLFKEDYLFPDISKFSELRMFEEYSKL